ncbi:MAG: amino-acid N-acetyltransferase [Myxococcota bacterium]
MSTDRGPTSMFVESFRASAPYIQAHRGRTFVVVAGGEALQGQGLPGLVQDIALLHALGVRVVLVAGARPQIDQRLRRRNRKPRYHDGLRITDDAALECVKEATGAVRLDLESRFSVGLRNTPGSGERIRVAAGNFVTARPVGVLDGVDYQHTGEVRRVDAEGIRQRLDAGAIVLLTPLGYSGTGDLFNVSSHDMAATTALALGADKLVAIVDGKGLTDGKRRPIHEVTPGEALELADRKRVPDDVRRHLRAAARVVTGGVRRAHLVSRLIDGGLLLELFTRDGVGTLVSEDPFEGVRPATFDDVGGVLELIEPLERDGQLVRRPREMLEMDINRFVVIERDGMVVACAALYPYPDEGVGELACVAVHSDYRQAGRGDVLLQWVEKRCAELGLDRLFVLTTQATQWFRERGFTAAKLRDLPEARRALYDRGRRSKILLKHL